MQLYRMSKLLGWYALMSEEMLICSAAAFLYLLPLVLNATQELGFSGTVPRHAVKIECAFFEIFSSMLIDFHFAFRVSLFSSSLASTRP